MTNDIIIKSNRYGINLILDDQLPFPELLVRIGEKFKGTEKFFSKARMAISFEGRKLSDQEKREIIDTIMAHSTLEIVCILDDDKKLEERMKERLEQSGANAGGKAAAGTQETEGAESDFYKGNLRSGQVLESAANITLIGDVNPGARIISQGNIVILGSLRGNACAGAGGDSGCFIFALDMKPIQLQIGEFIAKSPDREKAKRRLLRKDKGGEDGTPQVALVREGNICIEPMTKGCLDAL